MEDIKWLIRKWGLFLFILLVVAIVGCLSLKGLESNERKIGEDIWEPPVEITSKELKNVINAEAEVAEQLEKGYDLPTIYFRNADCFDSSVLDLFLICDKL